MRDDKEGIKQVVLSIIMVIVLLGGSFIIVKYRPSPNKNKVNIELSSELVSTDAKVSAANFITAAGTMGDVDRLTIDVIEEEGYGDKIDRRLAALVKVEDAMVPGSPLVDGNEKRVNKNFANEQIYPTFFAIKNVKASEPVNVGKITSFDDSGNVEYDAVEVYIGFDSVMTTFEIPQDGSGDGSIKKVEKSDNFDNVKVTLVKSGELWFIYDVEESETLLNVRLSTWSGLGVNTVKPNGEVVEILKGEVSQDE